MRSMSRTARVLLATALLAAVVWSAEAAPAGAVTAGQLAARFKGITGDKLLVSKKSSSAGHSVELDLGMPSISKQARYGQFTIYVVSGADFEAEVAELLKDAHTGKLGTPGLGNIHWESGSTLAGDRFWLAKRRYGANVVVWWIGTGKKTDASFTRLHRALTAAVASR